MGPPDFARRFETTTLRSGKFEPIEVAPTGAEGLDITKS
jgi:hypothetical protein